MQETFQKTLSKPILFSGIGLHSGAVTNVKLLPADDNKGILFVRTDLNKNNTIEANYKNVSSAKLCTILENEFGATVSTIEHLMAAFYITGIDNIIVEIDNPEVPIMDGSSLDFVKLINETGLKNLNSKRKFLKILKKVELKESSRSISIEPNLDSLDIDFQLNYKNQIIGNQNNFVSFNNDNLENVISSRTFCLYEDIEEIKKIGLAKGGSLENAVVVNDTKVLNEGGLRNEKEFVNHKILDLAGDFLLSGYRTLGTIKCSQGGHLLTNLFLKELLKDSSNYQVISNDNIEVIKKHFKTPINKLAVNS
jgi:UDP-3-O-[3-hydroxymyristoyl] N-acetylglucosamine deacetylase